LKNAQKSITPTTFSCHGGSMKWITNNRT
jgi:hypothetical protein